MIITGGTCYFSIDYVDGCKTLLSTGFTGGLNRHGDGCVNVRNGGRRAPVIVKGRKLDSGGRKFVEREKIPSGTTFLIAHNGGRTIALLRFANNMGDNVVWHSNVDAFDIESQLVMEDDVSPDVVTQTIRTAYFPTYMSLFLARPSGLCVFEQSCYISIRAPCNLAQHLLSENRPHVTIRSGERLFADIEVSLGFFRGPKWTALVEACEFDIGFKIFLFLNYADEFEAVYDWARTYYKIM